MQNSKLIDFFLDKLQYERRLSAHTVLAYKTDLLQFESFVSHSFDDAELLQIGFPELRAWIVSLSEDKLSPRSINRKIASLRAFYGYLLKQKDINKDPTVKLKVLKTKSSPPQFIEEKATEKLFDEIDFPQTFEGGRDRLILTLLYSTGIRLAELVGLKTNQVDIVERKITVLGKRNKFRVVPFPDGITGFLQEYIQERDEMAVSHDLFFVKKDGKPVYPILVQRLVKKYLGMITSQKKKSPHVLRHTYATHLLNNGAELNAIKELLGHTSLAATQVYTHNSIEKLKEVHKKAHPKS